MGSREEWDGGDSLGDDDDNYRCRLLFWSLVICLGVWCGQWQLAGVLSVEMGYRGC